MTRRISFSEIEQYKAGNNAIDFLVEVGDKAREIACGLYSLHPDQVNAGYDLTPDFVRAYFDRMCAPVPTYSPPAFPSIQFPGGQCEGELYYLEYSSVRIVGGDFDGWNPPFTTSPVQVEGPVPLVQLYIDGNPSGLLEHWGFLGNGVPPLDGARNRVYSVFIPGQGLISLGASNPGRKLQGWKLLSGGIDNCGDPEPEFPPSPPLTVAEIFQDIKVNLNSGVNIEIPVEVGVDADFKLEIPFNFDFGGLQVDLDVAGIIVRNEVNLGGGGSPSVLTDGGGEGEGSGEPGDAPSPEETPEEFDFTPAPPATEGEETPGSRLAYVRLVLTEVPSNAKRFDYPGSTPRYQAGWFCFKIGSSYLPIQFVDFADGYFVAPLGADGYAFALRTGYTGSITVITKKEE